MAQCIVELVLNAIDAGATSIAVRIDFQFHKIQVIDNGFGMNCTNLDLIGARFMTSKCHSMDDFHNHLSYYGFRGEALASLREVSGMLVLESRPKGSDLTYCKAFTHGKPHKAAISKTERASHGTTVTVLDFMYNMPVRRKRVRSEIDAEEIKFSIECIALTEPQISFSLRNDSNGNVILHTRKCSDTRTAFSYLYGNVVSQSLVAVSSSSGDFKICGYVSKEAHHHKNLQFIYINKRLLLKTKLHKLVNSMLGRSFILKTNKTANDLPISKETSTGRWLAFPPPIRRDRYAVYILNIECPYSAYDISLDPKKTLIEFCDWDTVLQCMETTIRTFLETEFPASLSQGSQEKSVDDLSTLQEIEKDNVQKHSECQEKNILPQGRGSDTHKVDSALRTISHIPGAIVGKVAKREEANCDASGHMSFLSRDLNVEKTGVHSQLTEILNSSVSTYNNNDVLNGISSNSSLYGSDPEDPFPKSHRQTEKNNISTNEVQKNDTMKLSLKPLNRSMSGISEAPIIDSDGEEFLKMSRRSQDFSNVSSMDKFRNFLKNYNTVPKTQSVNEDLPSITKFRKMFGLKSDIEFTKSVTVQQHMFPSSLNKVKQITTKTVNEINMRPMFQPKNGTVDSCIMANGKLHCKDSKVLSTNTNIPAELKHSRKEIIQEHAAESRSTIVLSKELSNMKNKLNKHSVHNFTFDSDSEIVQKLHGFKVSRNCENAEKKRMEIDDVGKNWTSTTTFQNVFSDKIGTSITHSDNHETIIETHKECLEIQIHNPFSFSNNEHANTSLLQSEQTSTSGYFVNGNHYKVDGNQCNFKNVFMDHVNCKSYNHLFNQPTALNSRKYNDTDQFSFDEMWKCFYNQLEKNNLQKSNHRSIMKSSDFLHTIEEEKDRRNECSGQVPSFQNNCLVTTDCLIDNSASIKHHNKDHLCSSMKTDKHCIEWFNRPGTNFFNITGEECLTPISENVTITLSPEEVKSQSGNEFLLPSSNQNLSDEENLMKKNDEHLVNSIRNNCTGKDFRNMLTNKDTLTLLRSAVATGEEADVEQTTESELCPRRKSTNKRTIPDCSIPNERSVKHMRILEWLNAQPGNGNDSRATFKMNVCDSHKNKGNLSGNSSNTLNFNDSAKLALQDDILLQVQQMTVDSDGKQSCELLNEVPQQIEDKGFEVDKDSIRNYGSNETIVPSSGSSRPLLHLNISGKNKPIIEDSSPDISMKNYNIVNESPDITGTGSIMQIISEDDDKFVRNEYTSSYFKENVEDDRNNKFGEVEYEDSVATENKLDPSTCAGQNVQTEELDKVRPQLFTGISDSINLLSITDISHTSKTKNVECESKASEMISDNHDIQIDISPTNSADLTFAISQDTNSNLMKSLFNSQDQGDTNCKFQDKTSELLMSGTSSNDILPCGQTQYLPSKGLCERAESNLDSNSGLNIMSNSDTAHINQNCTSQNEPSNYNIDSVNISDSCESTSKRQHETILGLTKGPDDKENSENIQIEESTNNTLQTVTCMEECEQNGMNKEQQDHNDNSNKCLESENIEMGEDTNKTFETAMTSLEICKQNIINEEQQGTEEYNNKSNTDKSAMELSEQNVTRSQCNSSERKRRSSNNSMELNGKKRCTEEINSSVHVPETLMSDSISTQKLNKAFDCVMTVVTESNVNQSIEKNDNIVKPVLENEMKVNKEISINSPTKIADNKEGDLKCPEEWEQRLDNNGKAYFIHKETGLTTYLAPKQSLRENIFLITKRFAFLPKGISPVLKGGMNTLHAASKNDELTPDTHQALCNAVTDTKSKVDEMMVVKWKDGQKPIETGCSDLVRKMLEESDNRMQFCENPVRNGFVEELPKNIVKVYKSMHPFTFTKESLTNFEVLGQLDNKFIVTIVSTETSKKPNLIVFFDQHAVHERIRLENLMNDYLVDGSESEFKTSAMDPEINLILSSQEIRILSSFQSEFKKLGLQYEILNSTTIKVKRVPQCLLARELREVSGRGTSVMKDSLESMIREQVDSILTTRGIGTSIPAVLQSIISSEACRGAVKFGDTLLLEECENLLKDLSKCKVPFQCAHGRPSLIPIMDMNYLHFHQTPQARSKPQLWKLRKKIKTFK